MLLGKIIRMWIVLWIMTCPAFAALAERPKLVVLIAIDQFRADYLTRFEKLYLPPIQKNGKPGGFRFLTERGAFFPNTQTGHHLNVTGVGHTAMLTGALPHLHGIVANYWFDAESKKIIYCTEGASPRNLLVSTVGDELKNAHGGKPLVVSVALKDRAAILMGGHRADLALWFNDKTGQWVTSSHYVGNGPVPRWVADWNNQKYWQTRTPKTWNTLLPAAKYWQSHVLPESVVSDGHGLGKRFPHAIDGKLAPFLVSPFSNSFVLETALIAVGSMKLGANSHGVADLLAVSLSGFDALGHHYGPLSIEMQDAAIRLDRMLADFLARLSTQVPGGLKNVVIALTGDHGVQINPAFAPQIKLPGGTYPDEKLTADMNNLLRKKMDFSDDEKPVAFAREDHIWLDRALLRSKKKDRLEAARHLVSWLREQPYIAGAYTKEDLLAGRVPSTLIAQRMSVSAHATRSGDVLITGRPGYLPMSADYYGGTEHESAVTHDASIPLVLFGSPFKPGIYYNDARLIDLAPTLSSVLGIIAPSGSEGRALSYSLKAL